MRVLIVDDEPLARRGIHRLLAGRPGVDVVGECANGVDAVRAIVETAPDLVFLDVRMPGLSGFDVIERVGAEAMPAVVFVTGYGDYALRAFEVHALDYVLKPIDPDRFNDAFERAARQVSARHGAALADRLAALLDRLPDMARGTGDVEDATRVPVKAGGRIVFVAAGDIDWVEAAGNYVRLHVGSQVHVVRRTVERMGQRLGAGFVRIRRSALVNMRAVISLEPYAKGSYLVLLRNGDRLTSSRHYAAHLKVLLTG